ncbi:hypothetical protein BACT_0488 [Bifidobacterium actinocoloniiforme DSM 22766]|uniref:Uncharacterized protein n=1 Tax=Bifidobacterium actinocoloniiforme DSM 22766 TaxID=1437605 RepID=A0A086YZT8_9BIFI|nr:hypothetical protein [Bifidobacterium actinocoloniiforme]AKV55077.1 hypothetical protein AB656_01060 [Bifidobacterium actinocoloniiforme DSM 22766]KFI39788.1 hypothetical protein BACT_0488 [Bifidobacterium actinocoloniiforme DSM 22766]
MLSREILRDHTSSSYAALSGWSYIPTGAEIALWDQMELEGRLKRKGYRPWTDQRADPFRLDHMEGTRQRRERLERRKHLQDTFHISN